jgi:excisionase family DNA binding protein
MTMLTEWLSIQQAADVAGCGRTTVHEALVAGELDCVVTCLGRLVHESDVKEWAAARHAQVEVAR